MGRGGQGDGERGQGRDNCDAFGYLRMRPASKKV